jgi:hypothetical protein
LLRTQANSQSLKGDFKMRKCIIIAVVAAAACLGPVPIAVSISVLLCLERRRWAYACRSS